MDRLVRNALTLLLLAIPCLLLLPRLNAPIALPDSALDQLIAARDTAAHNRLGTLIVRPFEVRQVVSYGDGALPDLSHGMLYSTVAGLSMKLLRETKGGQGQRATTFLGLGLLITGSLLTLWLAQRCFPQRDGRRSALLFVWSGGAILAAVTPGPGLLLAVLGALLWGALIPLDVSMSDKRASIGVALAVGALWGLLFLTIYSALLLLPVLLWHVIRVTRRDPRAILAFLMCATLFALPQLARGYKATRNPLYHSRWVEIAMRTESFPGTGLYHAVSLPKAITNYLPNGGFLEVGGKSGKTLTELLPRTLGAFGLSLVLFLASGLIRFHDQRLNTLRRLLFILMPLHLGALSLFFPADECASVLLLYAPLVATLAMGFLETVVQVRRLPRVHARGALLVWLWACGASGLAQLLALRPAREEAEIYGFRGASADYLERLQMNTDGVLAANDPFRMAFYANIPVCFLPASATDFKAVESRLNKPIVGFGVTPDLRWSRPEDAVMAPWAETYSRVIGLFRISELLPTQEREALRRRISYPESLMPVIQTFQVTPIREPRQNNDYSAIFWEMRYIQNKPRS